jgi:DNA modification methylase
MLKMPVVLFGANCFTQHLPVGSWLVWDKRFANGKAFLADGEVAWMNRGHGVYIYSETAQGCVRKEPVEHPTQKPVGVMAWCMEKAKVPEGAVVLDPYMGSGTTGVACIRTGRRFVGIEKDADHFKTARDRIHAELAQGDLFFGCNRELNG